MIRPALRRPETRRGPYDGLSPSWAEFDARIAAQGLVQAPDLWRCYVAEAEPSPDPADWATELNRPLIRS